MKLKCVKNSYVEKKLFGGSNTILLEGLTLNKTHEGQAITVCDNITISNATQIQESDYVFMVYNDHNEWETYTLDCFIPA